MISSVRGPVLHSGAGFVIVGVGGLGLRVEVPSGVRAPSIALGDEVLLHTVLIVREDSLTLYGFSSSSEIEVFEQLMTVSGVGPRSALGVLSALTPAQIAEAVRIEDDKAFRQAPGIGPKTAKLLLVQLSGKLDGFVSDSGKQEVPTGSGATSTVVDGLVGLGWNESQATRAVSNALDAGAEEEPAVLLRAALALLQAKQVRGGGSV